MAYASIGTGFNPLQRRLGRGRGVTGARHSTTGHLKRIGFTSRAKQARGILRKTGLERASGRWRPPQIQDKRNMLYDLKYTPDAKRSAHSANQTFGTIRTSEGTQAIEKNPAVSTFEESMEKRKKRRTTKRSEDASILRRRSE